MLFRYLLPIATLLACLWLLTSRHRESSRLQEANELLTIRLGDDENPASDPGNQDSPSGSSSFNSSAGSLSDETLSQYLRTQNTDPFAHWEADPLARVAWSDLIYNSSLEKLADLARHIDSLTLTNRQRRTAYEEIFGRLNELDPVGALELAFTLKNRPPLMIVKPAFATWLASDATAALQWFDEKVAAGDFEGKGLSDRDFVRQQFESDVLWTLSQSNPALARERMANLSPEDRSEIFSSLHQPYQAESLDFAAPLAALAREFLSPEDFSNHLVSVGNAVSSGDLSQASEYMNRVGLSPEDRSGIASRLLLHHASDQAPTPESLETYRSYITENLPDDPGYHLGQAISNTSRGSDFEESREFFESEYTVNPDERLLAGFLDGLPVNQLRQSSELISQVTDPEVAARLQSKLNTP